MLNRRTVIAGAAASVPAAAVGAVLAAPDAELIALGERLKAAWQIADAICAGDEVHAEASAALDIVHAIREEVIAMRATTLAGLKVKASAVSCCGDDTDYDEGAIGALIADLQAMGAAS